MELENARANIGITAQEMADSLIEVAKAMNKVWEPAKEEAIKFLEMELLQLSWTDWSRRRWIKKRLKLLRKY